MGQLFSSFIQKLHDKIVGAAKGMDLKGFMFEFKWNTKRTTPQARMRWVFLIFLLLLYVTVFIVVVGESTRIVI